MALRGLRERGIKQHDEQAIFQAIESMRELTKKSCKKSKAARRLIERQPEKKEVEVICDDSMDHQVAEEDVLEPYEDIELW